MAEYVEREEVLKTLDILFDRANDRYYKAMPHAVLMDVKGLMKTMDAADVAPVVHGEWIWNGKHWECSNCRHDRLHDLVLGLDAAYCPYCGADMRERKGDDGSN